MKGLVHVHNISSPARQFSRLTRGMSALILLAFVSCQSAPPGRTRVEYPVALEETYTVGAPDMLSINVFPQQELSQDVRVRPDGKISMNLIGDVFVEGLTPEEIDAKLTNELSRYLKGAEITVTVTDFQSKRFYVVGEVTNPGMYPYRGKTSVLTAVMTAGSYSRRANTHRFILVRPSEDKPEVVDVDFEEFMTTGNATYDLYLQPGDVLYVPPTGLAKTGYAIEALLFPFQPLLGPAAFALGIYAITDDNNNNN